MTIRPTLWNRLLSLSGLVCLAMSLLLLPVGVRSVRADNDAEGLVSAAPAPPTPSASEPAISQKPGVGPAVEIDEAKKKVLLRSRASSEVQPEVIVLNTRGFNYGPSPAGLDPATYGRGSETP